MAYNSSANTYRLPHELPKVDKCAFEGKEFESRMGLDMADFGPRGLLPDIGSFASPDPLASATPAVTPYAYCAADPVNLADPSGMRIIYNSNGMDYTCMTNEDGTSNFQNDLFWKLEDDDNGNILLNTLNEIGSKPIGRFFLNQIVDDEQSIYINKGEQNYYSPTTKTVMWTFGDENEADIPKPLLEIRSLPASLFHEFSHAFDDLKGITNYNFWFNTETEEKYKNELIACQRENLFRVEHGLPLREYFAFGENGIPIPQTLVSTKKS